MFGRYNNACTASAPQALPPSRGQADFCFVFKTIGVGIIPRRPVSRGLEGTPECGEGLQRKQNDRDLNVEEKPLTGSQTTAVIHLG